MTTVAALTIGQSPRPDVVGELRRVLNSSIAIVERGVLDGLARSDVPPVEDLDGSAPLITRLRDGCSVIVESAFVEARLQAVLDSLTDEVTLVALLCTGTFDRLRCRVPILHPDRVLASLVAALSPSRLGVLIPLATQREHLLARWRARVSDVRIEVASPYGDPGDVAAAARRLDAQDVGLVVLDCIGYTREARDVVRAATGRPALLASASLAHVIALLVG